MQLHPPNAWGVMILVKLIQNISDFFQVEYLMLEATGGQHFVFLPAFFFVLGQAPLVFRQCPKLRLPALFKERKQRVDDFLKTHQFTDVETPKRVQDTGLGMLAESCHQRECNLLFLQKSALILSLSHFCRA